MDNSVLASTFFLTLLLGIGLLFFVRASTKDRTQVVTYTSDASNDQLLASLKQYFADRAYQVDEVDSSRNKVVLSGQVSPSWFMAIFLSFLAGIGALCLGLVMSISMPDVPYVWASFLAASPLTGWFYWKKAGRIEQVSFLLDEEKQPPTGSFVIVRGHRDELETLKQSLDLRVDEFVAVD